MQPRRRRNSARNVEHWRGRERSGEGTKSGVVVYHASTFDANLKITTYVCLSAIVKPCFSSHTCRLVSRLANTSQTATLQLFPGDLIFPLDKTTPSAIYINCQLNQASIGAHQWSCTRMNRACFNPAKALCSGRHERLGSSELNLIMQALEEIGICPPVFTAST